MGNVGLGTWGKYHTCIPWLLMLGAGPVVSGQSHSSSTSRATNSATSAPPDTGTPSFTGMLNGDFAVLFEPILKIKNKNTAAPPFCIYINIGSERFVLLRS